MTKQVPFHELLRSERERAGLSLRRLAERAGQNPGSLSRMEAGTLTPRLPTLLRLAEAVAAERGLDTSQRDALIGKFLHAAERSTNAEQTLQDVRDRFAAMLRERKLGAEQIDAALTDVTPSTMARVVRGEEPLDIHYATELANPNHGINLNQEVVVLPLRTLSFPAGPRARITIDGELTASQQQQVRLAAKLIASLLNEDAHD